MPLKRLTRRDSKRPEIVRTECENCVSRGENCTGWHCATVLAKRLAAYEDRGLTPNQLHELEAVVQNAAFIVNGYAFECSTERIRVLNLNDTSKVAFVSKSGEILDASMDEIEVNIVLSYWDKNKQFAED